MADVLYADFTASITQHLNATETIEFEILPSGLPLPEDSGPLLQDGNAIALRQRDLIQIFLIGRRYFFEEIDQHVNSHSRESYDISSGEQDKPSLSLTYGSDKLLQTTLVLLLFAPEHLAATNVRKRHLEALIPDLVLPHEPFRSVVEALRQELTLLDSFATSPLPKHPKSPNLWSHRFWVLRRFTKLQCQSQDATASDVHRAEELAGLGKWHITIVHEVSVVLKAGDRHFANYVAFDYARQMYDLLLPAGRPSDVQDSQSVHKRIVEQVCSWCLAHPRDISGWTFLDFLLRKDGSLLEAVEQRTRRFLEMTGCMNKAIEWFLEARGWSME